jgi:hypothetical protein
MGSGSSCEITSGMVLGADRPHRRLPAKVSRPLLRQKHIEDSKMGISHHPPAAIPQIKARSGVRKVPSERTHPDALTFMLCKANNNGVSLTSVLSRSFINGSHSNLKENLYVSSGRPHCQSKTGKGQNFAETFDQLDKLQFNERMSVLIEFCTHPQSGRGRKRSFASSSIQSRVVQVTQNRL